MGAKHADGKQYTTRGACRFWEGRQDFSVLNRSAVRITFKDEKVSVYIDARGNNDWKTCFQNAVIPAAAGWWRNGAYMGMSSSTGDLADNHDVLSVQVGLEDEVAPDDEEMPIAMVRCCPTPTETCRQHALCSTDVVYV
jgi:hypothetical protein